MTLQFEDFESFASHPPPRAAPPLERLTYLLGNSSAIIYSSVPSGDFRLTFVSDNCFQLLGYRPWEMLADHNFWFDHLHPDDIPDIISSLALLFVEGERTYEYRFRTATGEYLWMHDHLRLIRDECGTPVEVIGALSDITSRKKLEHEQLQLHLRLREAHDQLLQSEKMASIGQLAAGVAHEINNPVGFVNSNLNTLDRYVRTLLSVVDAHDEAILQAAPGSALAMRLDAIAQEADLAFLKEDIGDLIHESLEGLARVRNIVQSLKDFSHVGETDWRFADMHAGLDSTLNIVANEIKYKAGVVKCYGQLPEVWCLASQLNQVFMNLLINAAQAIHEHGTITVTTGSDDASIWIAISDTGCGIPKQNINRIFEPFFTTKPVGSGTGLGLSLSYSIVKTHGGRIEVDSSPAGSTFTIWLPIASPSAVPAIS